MKTRGDGHHDIPSTHEFSDVTLFFFNQVLLTWYFCQVQRGIFPSNMISITFLSGLMAPNEIVIVIIVIIKFL